VADYGWWSCARAQGGRGGETDPGPDSGQTPVSVRQLRKGRNLVSEGGWSGGIVVGYWVLMAVSADYGDELMGCEVWLVVGILPIHAPD